MSSSKVNVTELTRKATKSGQKSDHLISEMAMLIVNQQLPVGSLLASENELSKHYNMSRPHVRQALQRLAAGGLLETRHGLGSYINPSEAWNLFDPILINAFIQSGNLAGISKELVELRKMVEVECSGLAAQRITTTDLEKLKRALDQMDATLDNPEAIAQEDIRFHNIIIAASRNRFFQGIMTFLEQPLSRSRLLTMQTGGKQGRLRAQAHHKAIYNAIASKNATEAEQAMRIHIQQLEEDITKALASIKTDS